MLDSKDGLLNRLSVVPVSRRMVVPGRVLCVSEEREVTRHEVLMMAGARVRQGSRGVLVVVSVSEGLLGGGQ